VWKASNGMLTREFPVNVKGGLDENKACNSLLRGERALLKDKN